MSMLAVAGRFEEAAERIRRSLERHPDNPQLLNNYGVALYQAGKKEAAIEQYRRALEIAPDYREARGNLAAAAGEGPAPAAVHLPADDPRQPPGP
jgi:Flp pilus assembly protein TadD